MKLNYRDKVILAVVLALIVCVGGFFGLIKPKSKEINESKATLAAKEAKVADIKNKIARIDPLTNDINDIYDDTNNKAKLFVPMEEINNPVVLDEYMQDLANENNVRINTVNLGQTGVGTLPYYFYTPTDIGGELRGEADFSGALQAKQNEINAESSSLSARNAERVLATQYGVNITGTKEDIWNYVQAVADIKNAVILNSLSLTDYTFGANQEMTVTNEDGSTTTINVSAGEDGTSDAQIVITLYSVYTMTKPNTDMAE